MRADALGEVVVAEGVRHPQVAGGAEGLAWDDRHLDLVQDDVGQRDRRVDDVPSDRLAEHALHRRVRVEGTLRARGR